MGLGAASVNLDGNPFNCQGNGYRCDGVTKLYGPPSLSTIMICKSLQLFPIKSPLPLTANRPKRREKRVRKQIEYCLKFPTQSIPLKTCWSCTNRSTDHLGRVIDVTNFYISIVDNEKRTLQFPYHVDTMGENFHTKTDFDYHLSLTGLIVSKRKPILLRKKELEAWATKGGVKGLGRSVIWMGSPLIVKDRVIGVMVALSYDNPDLYDQNDLDILSAVSEQVAIAIDRKQTEEARKKSEETNKTLFEISNAVNTTLNLDELYRSIHQSLARIIDVTNFFIAIVDSKKRTTVFSISCRHQRMITSIR